MIEKIIDEIEYSIRNNAKISEDSPHDFSLHEDTTKHVEIDGLWLEFGVYEGHTISKICEATDKTVYGFDCFTGLPESMPECPEGMFNMSGQPPKSTPSISSGGACDPKWNRKGGQSWKNVEFIVGLFQDTLEDFLKSHPEPIAYIHIDSDLYSSAAYILEILEKEKRLIPGSIIVFDEILNLPDYRQHEIKAYAEYINRSGLEYETLYRMPDMQGNSLRSWSPASFKLHAATKK